MYLLLLTEIKEKFSLGKKLNFCFKFNFLIKNKNQTLHFTYAHSVTIYYSIILII